jgi:hypothetical protein
MSLLVEWSWQCLHVGVYSIENMIHRGTADSRGEYQGTHTLFYKAGFCEPIVREWFAETGTFIAQIHLLCSVLKCHIPCTSWLKRGDQEGALTHPPLPTHQLHHQYEGNVHFVNDWQRELAAPCTPPQVPFILLAVWNSAIMLCRKSTAWFPE